MRSVRSEIPIRLASFAIVEYARGSCTSALIAINPAMASDGTSRIISPFWIRKHTPSRAGSLIDVVLSAD